MPGSKFPAPAGHTSKKRRNEQGGRLGRGCRKMGHGLPKGQRHRKELQGSSLEGQGEDIRVGEKGAGW